MYITTLKNAAERYVWFLWILVSNSITVKIQSKSTYLRKAEFNVFLQKMHTLKLVLKNHTKIISISYTFGQKNPGLL